MAVTLTSRPVALEGRLTDIIKTGGANCVARRSRQCLVNMSGVKAAATVAYRMKPGEIVVSCIVPHGESLSTRMRARFLKQRLASYRCRVGSCSCGKRKLTADRQCQIRLELYEKLSRSGCAQR